MGFKLGPRSLLNLRGVHPDLVAIVKRAIEISDVDFTVIEGVRTKKRQAELVAKGASRTMKSRHIGGFAVDIVPYVGGKVRWDWPLFDPIRDAMFHAAHELGIEIEWGGDWKGFPDGPHWQLPVRTHPDKPW